MVFLFRVIFYILAGAIKIFNNKRQIPVLKFYNLNGKEVIWIGPFRNETEQEAGTQFSQQILDQKLKNTSSY
jgi:hypothetical protein